MYQVLIEKRVYKDLDKIPIHFLNQIYERIVSLEVNPHPPGCSKLKGYTNRFRLRQGDYRIILRQGDYRIIYTVN